MEDVAELVGIEDALRADLRGGIGNLLNNQAVNGNGNAPNVEGILDAVAATPTTNPANADDFGEITARILSVVDGLHAVSPAEVRAVMAPDIYEHMVTVQATNDDSVSAFDYLSERLGGIMVNTLIPDKSNNDIGRVICYRGGSGVRHAVLPVWSNLEIIVDPFSLAQQGEVRLTATVLFNFALTESAAFVNRKIRTS